MEKRMMTKLEFIMKNSSYPSTVRYLEAPLAVGLFQHSALRSTTGNPSCLLPLGCTTLFPLHMLPRTLLQVRRNDIEQGHSFPCKNPLPLTDNTFISLTERNGISLHVLSCLIAIGGYTVYHVSFSLLLNFPQGSIKYIYPYARVNLIF